MPNPYLTTIPDNQGDDPTLRDLFEAFSLAGLRAEGSNQHSESLARQAYLDADALMAVRAGVIKLHP